MKYRAITLSSIAAVVLGVATLHAAALSRQQADTFARKVIQIHEHGTQPKPKAKRTTISETELNSWFTYRGQPLFPTGLTGPKLTIVGNGKLMGTVTVDLEAIGKARNNSFDLLRLFPGKLPIAITGVLHSQNGQGRFELQSADVSGVPLPTTLVSELVAYYTRTDTHPQGYRLQDPFALPANIKQIQIGQGQAIVVQ